MLVYERLHVSIPRLDVDVDARNKKCRKAKKWPFEKMGGGQIKKHWRQNFYFQFLRTEFGKFCTKIEKIIKK